MSRSRINSELQFQNFIKIFSCRLFSGVKNLEVIGSRDPFFTVSNIKYYVRIIFCFALVLALELLNLSASLSSMFISANVHFPYVFVRKKHCFRKRLWKEDEKEQKVVQNTVCVTTKNLSWTDLKANVLILWLNL